MQKRILWALALVILVPIALAALFPEATARLAIDYERSRAGLDAESRVIDGETWYFLAGGPEDGETLLLLHGFGGNKDNWVRVAAQLTDRYRLVIPDLPGFGETAHDPDGDYSIPTQAERVHRFATALGLGRVHVAGHSMGGYIAGVYAHQHPERIATLALVTNAGIRSPVRSDVARMVAAGDNPLVPRTREEYHRLIEIASFEPVFIPWPVKSYLADQAVAEADFRQYLFEFLRRDEPDLGSRLSELDLPLFVLWGRHDRLIDVSTVDVIRDIVPEAEVVILEDAGHLPIIEAPAATAGHYREFLERHAG